MKSRDSIAIPSSRLYLNTKCDVSLTFFQKSAERDRYHTKKRRPDGAPFSLML